jgi:hypothetical protein
LVRNEQIDIDDSDDSSNDEAMGARSSFVGVSFRGSSGAEDDLKPLIPLEPVRKKNLLPVFHPQSLSHISWDCFGALLVAYECVMCPMQLLKLPTSVFVMVMMWVIRVYWSLDLFLCFRTGYENNDGHVEKVPSRIALRYLRTWFPFDFVLISCDWAEAVIEGYFEDVTAVRPVLKILRMFRMARMMRVIRMSILRGSSTNEITQALQHVVKSELFNTVTSLSKNTTFVIWVNHVIACCWFSLGKDGGSTGTDTWLTAPNQVHNLTPMSRTSEIYAIAYHWSLAQFAGTMEVYPSNFRERTFSVVTLFVAFLMAAIFISSVTSAMTRLEIVMAEQTERLTSLRQFLSGNDVSSRVSMLIIRNVKRNIKKALKDQQEDNVQLLSMVSASLVAELHAEMFGPILEKYLFMKHFFHSYPVLKNQVCDQAACRLDVVRGEMLFCSGEAPPVPKVYWVVSGKMSYSQGKKKVSVEEGAWFCDAVLWTPWMHCGNMRVKSEQAHLVTLDVEVFIKIATSAPQVARSAAAFGKMFVGVLNNLCEDAYSDLPIGRDDLNMDEILENTLPWKRKSSIQTDEVPLEVGKGVVGMLRRGFTKSPAEIDEASTDHFGENRKSFAS